jgi:sugar lactone lactonase YvrE
MRTKSAAAVLGAGLVAMNTMTGCIPFPGGCGGVDPVSVAAFQLTAASAATAPAEIDGIAAAPDGVWMLENDSVSRTLVEYDRPGGVEQRRIALAASEAFGLAWDGTALWVGTRGAAGAAAWRIDPASGARLATIALPNTSADLAWNGTDLIVVEGLGAFDEYEPATGKLAASVPVRQLDSVFAVAYHDGETWVAQPVGGTALVYDATGTLLATVPTDAFQTTSQAHMTFVGEDLVVARGTDLSTYAIDRTAPTK